MLYFESSTSGTGEQEAELKLIENFKMKLQCSIGDLSPYAEQAWIVWYPGSQRGRGIYIADGFMKKYIEVRGTLIVDGPGYVVGFAIHPDARQHHLKVEVELL